MPIYEYVCLSCEREFEELVRSASSDGAVRCPHCQGEKITRKLSVFAARQGKADAPGPSVGGPCDRCHDPDGPCPLAP